MLEWRWKLGGSPALPAVLFFLRMLFGFPAIPPLAGAQRPQEEAPRGLLRVGEENVEREIRDIAESVHLETRGRARCRCSNGGTG